MSRSLQLAIWTALTALAVSVAHLPSLVHRLLDSDEAVYGSIAALMNQGQQLYAQGGVDNKPPGIFWIYATTFRLFGVYQMTAVHAVGLVVLAATGVLIFIIAFDLAGARAGLLATLFYGLLTATGNPQLLAANTEIFMMLPLTGSVLLLLRKQWLGSGVLFVAACAFRQTAAANLPLVVVAILWLQQPRERGHASGLFLAGLVGGLVALVALTAMTGSLAGLWRWTVEPLYGYASANWSTGVALSRASDSMIPFFLYTVVLWVIAVSFAIRWPAIGIGERLMVTWLGVGLLGSLAGSHLSWHYFIQDMAPLAVVAALSLERFRLKRSLAAVALAGVAVPVASWLTYDLRADPLNYGVHQHVAVSAYVDSHTSRSDPVFVWGDWPDVYVQSDRLMSTRFPGFLRGFPRGSQMPPDNWDTAPDVWPLLTADLNANPPKLIIDTSSASWSDFARYPLAGNPALAGFVFSHYRVVAVIDGVVIYGPKEGVER